MSYIKGLLALSLMMFVGTAVSISSVEAKAKKHEQQASNTDDSLGAIGRQDAKVFEPKKKKKK